MTTNFSFFRGKWDVLANLGETAERIVLKHLNNLFSPNPFEVNLELMT